MQEFRTDVETKLPEIPTGADSKLSQLAWAPHRIAEGKPGNTPAEKKDAAKEVPAKVKDAFVERAQINDRCALDVYEHHWELTLPKVTVPFNSTKVEKNDKGLPVLVLDGRGEEIVSSEKLIMDDKGVWTMKDDKGQPVEMIKQRTKQLVVDPKHPEKAVTVKQKDFANGTRVLVEENGQMTLIRNQDHVFSSKEGTPEFDKEIMANTLVVVFDKKVGVSTVVDKGKTYSITRDGDKP